MPSARLASVATIVGLTAALLAGCSSTSGTTHETSTQPSKTAAVVSVQPDSRQVRVEKLIDPNTLRVTPTSSSDSLYGTTFTLDVNTIAVPAEGSCGHDDAVAEAKTFVAPKSVWFIDYSSTTDDVYIGADGVHHGMLRYNVDDYGKSMVAAGMATVVGTPRFDYMTTAQTQAKADDAGLWSTCADFGA